MNQAMPRWQQLCGVGMYWLAWPALWFYLHSSRRTRVLVVCGRRVLLVKSWLGDGKWSLAGGGLHGGEDPKRGAQRELLEETALDLPVEAFTFIDHRRANSHGLVFAYDLFVVEVASALPVARQPREIVAIGWHDYEQLDDAQVAPDARDALRTWFEK